MKKNILNSFLLVVIVILAASCRPKKLIVKAPPVSEGVVVADKKAANLKTLANADLIFETLALKGKAELNVNGNENSVTLNIRIKKDQTIWFSVTALGGAFEAARGVITPDSILLMNRLQKTVIRKPFTYIHQFTNQQINFGWLQAILTGNNIKALMSDQSDLRQENGVWVLTGTKEKLAYKALFNTLLKTSELTVNDAEAAQGLKVNYDQYTRVSGGIFPLVLKMNSVAGNKNISVAVDFVKIDHNVAVEFPFTVPRSFELIR